MKRSSKIMACALALTTVVAAASCNNGGGRTDTTTAANTNAPAETTAATTTAALTTAITNDTDAAVQDLASKTTVDETLNPTKKIKWLCWWPIDETQDAAEIYKSNYGIPEEGSNAYGDEFADKIFVFNQVSWQDRYDALGKLIASGDSPDMFPFEINYFPLSAYRGMFQSIDGVIDTNTEEWSGTRAAMDQFMWGGKNYTPIIVEGLDSLWWYRRSVAEEAGLEDPYELYKNGEWTWDTMLDMAEKFKNSGENRYLTDGWYVQRSIVATTGVPFVSLENGKLKSNIHNPNIERAMEVVAKFAIDAQGYGYPKSENGWSLNYDWWASGNILFMVDGEWVYQTGGDLDNVSKDATWDKAEDVMFVPAPRDPEADQYYQLFKTDPYMLCVGAQNIEGYKAWIKCNLIASKDPDMQAASREKYKRDHSFTDEQIDLLEALKTGGAVKGLYDFRKGISAECTVDDGSSPVDKILNDAYNSKDNVFNQLLEENEGAINTAIDLMNSSVS